MNIRTELLEALVRQCVREVLDQVDERVGSDGKPMSASSGIGKGEAKPKKIKPKWMPSTKFKVNIKKTTEINEEEQDQKDKPAEPASNAKEEPPSQSEPKDSVPDNGPAEPNVDTSTDKGEMPSDPGKTEPPVATIKGPVFINPRDKSKQKSLRIQGSNDIEIDRCLRQFAASVSRNVKISLGAKRMAREAAKNPSASIFFYIGKMDPESDELFLMADKSLQVAKDDSVQPGEIAGMPSQMTNKASYTLRAWDDPVSQSNPDDKYAGWMNRGKITPTATPRYGGDDEYDPQGLTESAKSMIKKVVNRILDGQR